MVPPRNYNQKPRPAAAKLSYSQMSRLGKALSREFSLAKLFKYGYRNKEDISTLPPETMVIGSQNVVTTAASTISIRQGYVLDGPSGNQNTYGIDSSYDFSNRSGNMANLRKWGTNLEVRYINPNTNAVSWVNILSSLVAANLVNFTSFWDQNTELKTFFLFVNGDNNLYEWSGGVGSFASATSNTITLQGTNTTSQLGFYDNASNSGKFLLIIDGVTYTYTGVSGETFTGVMPDPSAAGIAIGDAVVQKPASITTSSITSLPSSFVLDLISTLANQVWYGSLGNNSIYVSKTNNYKDVSYSTPARLPAEGALLTLDKAPVGFSPQASNMYIAAGRDQWWISQTNQQTVVLSGVATPTETLYAARLKTAANQGAQSQALIGRYKNSLIYVSNEQIVNSLGLVKDIYSDPQVTNISDPIKYDIDSYNFAGGQVAYDNYYIYVLIPANNVLRMYNVNKQFWEAPQIMPLSRLYRTNVVGSTVYGHSAFTNESYQLFTGYNDNGNPINAVIAFPYTSQVGGAEFQRKSFDKVYTEGYISSNTNLYMTVNYDFGATSGSYTTIIPGTPSNIIFNRVTDGSLGQNSLGSQPIGTILNMPNSSSVPKFRVINTMPRVDVYEYQITYSTDDVDQNFALLRAGPAVAPSSNLPNIITI